MDDLFGHYIAGLVDGEGCFALSAGVFPSSPLFNRTVSFGLGLRDDDGSILKDIREFIGVGILRRAIVNTGRNKSCPQISYNVNKVKELAEVIVPFFNKYPLRAKKKDDFRIWSEGVLLLYEISNRQPVKVYRGYKRWTEKDREDIIRISKELHEIKTYRGCAIEI